MERPSLILLLMPGELFPTTEIKKTTVWKTKFVSER